MTEKEFLEKRNPIWLEGDDLHINRPTSNVDKNDIHAYLSKKYGYNWMFAIRGYHMQNSHVMLYIGDYECPNCTTLIAPYIFNYFPDIKYIGFGCNKGKLGEIWPPKILVARDMSCLSDDILNKQTEESI